jgi:hypothetical protein
VITSLIANEGELVQNSSSEEMIDLSDLFTAAQDCLSAAEFSNDDLDLSEIAGILAGETEQLKKAADGALTLTKVEAVSDAVTRAKEMVAETSPWTHFILEQSEETNSEIAAHYDNALGLVGMFDNLSLVRNETNNELIDILHETVEIALGSRDRAGLLSENTGGSVLLQNYRPLALGDIDISDIDTSVEMDCSAVVEGLGGSSSSVTGTITIDIVDDTLSIDCDIDTLSIELTGSFSFEPSKVEATNIVLSIDSADISNSSLSLVITAGSINAGLSSAVDVSDTEQSYSGENLSSLTVELDAIVTEMASDTETVTTQSLDLLPQAIEAESTDAESVESDSADDSAEFLIASTLESTSENADVTISGNIVMDILRGEAMDTSHTTITGVISDSLGNSLAGEIELSQEAYAEQDTPETTTSLIVTGEGETAAGNSFGGEISMSSNCSTTGVIPLSDTAIEGCTLYLTSFDAAIVYSAEAHETSMQLSIGTDEDTVEVSFGVEAKVDEQLNAQFLLTSNSTDISSGIGTLSIYYDINNEAIDRDSVSLYVDYNTTEESSTAITITNGAGGTIEFSVPSAAELAEIAATISVDDVEQGSISYDELAAQFMALFSDSTSAAASE